MESMRKWVFLALNLAAFLLVLYWLREYISLSEFLDQLKGLPTEALVGAAVLNIAVLGVYGARLSLLLPAPQLHALVVVVIGFGMNGVLPFRLGEVAKLAYAAKLFGIATSRLVASTAAEKLMDLCAILLLGLIISQLVVAPYLDRGIAIAGALLGVVVVGLVLIFLVIVIRERLGRKTHNWVTDVFDTFRLQRDKSRIARLMLLTGAIWVITVSSVYWMFGSVFPAFSPLNACVLTLVLALAIAIPSAPAGLGIVDAAIVAYLHQTLPVDTNQALASALAFHMIVVIPQVLGTAIIMLGVFFRRRRVRN